MLKREVIVVGGGIAGLTAALSLLQQGQQVLLIEKNEHCGGLKNSFSRQGFRFEGGARALVSAGLVKPLMKQFALDIEVLPNPITLGFEDQLFKIAGQESLNQYAAVLKRLYPESHAEVNKVISTISNIMDDMNVLYSVENPLFVDKKNTGGKVTLASIVARFKYFRTLYRMATMGMPFESYLDRLATNQSLKDIVGQHFFRKTPVFFALSYFALYDDYIYPKGGVGALIEKMVEAIRSRGGEVLCQTQIVNIEAQKKYLMDAAGNSYRYDKLIWAGDLKALYSITNDEGLADKALSAFRTKKQAVLAQSGAESVFSVFLAANLHPDVFRQKASGHVFYTPDRQGLGRIHTDELQALLRNWETVQKDDFYAWLARFCYYNTFEISIPVLRDSSAAPPGKTGLIISVLFDYELTMRLRARGWYEEFKAKMEEEVVNILSSSLYPGLKENTIFSFSATPWSIYDQVGSSEGSIVGWSFEREIPAVTNMIHLANSVHTALPDVYAAGKWVYSPAGGPTAIMTGRIAARACKPS